MCSTTERSFLPANTLATNFFILFGILSKIILIGLVIVFKGTRLANLPGSICLIIGVFALTLLA